MSERSDIDFELVGDTVKAIHALLHGKPPDIQGAILADCLAIYIAGHVVHGEPEKTAFMRRQILEMHFEAVKELIPVNAKIMKTDR